MDWRHPIPQLGSLQEPGISAADLSRKSTLLAAPRNWMLACCFGFALLTAIVPFARAFYRVEVNYNEGWDVYNAAVVAAHGQLYPARSGWTSVNYPMLWLVLAGPAPSLDT